MRARGFRISDLLALIAGLAVIFALGGDPAARRDPIEFVGPLVTTAAVAWLLATCLAARFGPASRRPARWGAAAFAAIYLGLTVQPHYPGPLASNLASSRLVSEVADPLTSLIQGLPSGASWAKMS